MPLDAVCLRAVVEELDPIIEEHCRTLGLEVMGNYYMFGDELCLEDSGMSFTLDGSGGLVDAFGDTLCQAFWAADKIPCTLSYNQMPFVFLLI